MSKTQNGDTLSIVRTLWKGLILYVLGAIVRTVYVVRAEVRWRGLVFWVGKGHGMGEHSELRSPSRVNSPSQPAQGVPTERPPSS